MLSDWDLEFGQSLQVFVIRIFRGGGKYLNHVDFDDYITLLILCKLGSSGLCGRGIPRSMEQNIDNTCLTERYSIWKRAF